MYLAKLFGNKVTNARIYNPWEHVISLIKSHGGKMRYPSKDAEYNVIYNRMYGYIPSNFTLDLRPDIRHFVTSLMVLHEKRENGSFYCRVDGLSKSFTSNDSKEDPLLITSIWSEISSQLKLLRENQLIGLEELLVGSLMVKGIKWCLREEQKRVHYLSRLNLHLKAYSLKNNFKIRNWENHNKALLYWM